MARRTAQPETPAKKATTKRGAAAKPRATSKPKNEVQEPVVKRGPGRPRKNAEATEKPRKPARRINRSITNHQTHPWFQGKLSADFDDMPKGPRVYVQREQRPMFAGLVGVWRIMANIDGVPMRLRVTEFQAGKNLTDLLS